MAYADYAAELLGFVPKLNIDLAGKLVNRAWKDIREHRPWSFLAKETILTAPALINTGTALVTQYSTLVTMDAPAIVALTGLANPLITLRQFRVSGGPIYNITGFVVAGGLLTLDRAYQATTDATATYQVYQCYYPAPSSSFLRWVSVVDPANARQLRLHWTRQEIDMRDPQRTSQGNPRAVVAYKLGTVGTDTSVPFFELWEHPVSQLAFFCLYQERGSDFSARDEALPGQIPEDLLMYRARYHAYEWAEANKGTHLELQGADWLRLRRDLDRDYKEVLQRTEKQDEETFLQMLTIPQYEHSPFGPIVDSNWLQTHAGPWG